MDYGVTRLYFPHDWGRARRADCLQAIAHYRYHPELSVRLGLLENSNVSTELADAVALTELRGAVDAEALAYVRREVARSKRVSSTTHELVAQTGEWEVWALLLNNPNRPLSVIQAIAEFSSDNPAVALDHAYQVSRAKEILKERGRDEENGRTP